MKNYKGFFFAFYALAVLGSIQTYKKQYGMEIFSIAGILIILFSAFFLLLYLQG